VGRTQQAGGVGRAAHAVARRAQVRGAPAIAIVAALAVAVELQGRVRDGTLPATAAAVAELVGTLWAHLKTSRPTAVNLFDAAAKLERITTTAAAAAGAAAASVEGGATAVVTAYVAAAEQMLAADVEDNVRIGRHGAAAVLATLDGGAGATLLTHCNTGSLATAGYGTALGIVRAVHAVGRLAHVYCTETRPYNQGARLTAYELVHERMPATLVTDSMVAALMAQRRVSAVVVGADRVAANGDTANKIGTYQLAIVAQHHRVPFYVAAPCTSIDVSLPSGAAIPIEERKPHELSQVAGADVDPASGQVRTPLAWRTVHVSAPGIAVWNPGFDVTPAALITALVTERGVLRKAPGASTFDVAGFLRALP
jgi:methylthioribose-1-phosphate isomerase